MLAVDLRGGTEHHVGLRAAAMRNAIWILVGLGFGVGIYLFAGPDAGFAYWAAYLLEKSLSVDNLFVFVLVFSYFGVPPLYQPRVLLWGILGTLVMRASLIAAGVALLERFQWVIYPFAGLLVWSAVRMLRGGEAALAEACCETGPRWVSRLIPVVPRLDDGRFFTRERGTLVATPLLGFLRPGPDVFFGSTPRAFGAPGAGGSFAFADPDARLGFAYKMDFYLSDDPCEKALRNAVYRDGATHRPDSCC